MKDEDVIRIISADEKCFIDESISGKASLTRASALYNELFSFEAAIAPPAGSIRTEMRLRIDSPLSELITVYRVESVPVKTPCFPGRSDAGYLRTLPGLYPDLLTPFLTDEPFDLFAGQLASLWFDIVPGREIPPGDYDIRLVLCTAEKEYAAILTLTVIGAELPAQSLIYTQWFHCDCLAEEYSVPVFSRRHWEIIANYMSVAAKNGINAILTPLLTPPLDTEPGGERQTIQLVDIILDDKGWSFGFDRLDKWIDLAKSFNITHFECSHFFTQWGAAHAPKVIAVCHGEEKRVFGWETDALSEDYRKFLRALIRALLEHLKKRGDDEDFFFHISDEPSQAQAEAYLAARTQICDLLDNYPVMDALSDYSLYEGNVVSTPVVAIDRIDGFIENGVSQPWGYYCCAQWKKVSNRFVAMPSSRGRIIGRQLYKFQIPGFLHWGFNFWNSTLSRHSINPYLVTDGESMAPAGDCFGVYPARDGTALETIHMRCFTRALHDLRAFRLAESLAGRQAVLDIIDPRGKLRFDDCTDCGKTGEMRETVNRLILNCLNTNESQEFK